MVMEKGRTTTSNCGGDRPGKKINCPGDHISGDGGDS